MGALRFIRETYGVPCKRGMRVIAQGHAGVITGGNGHFIRIKLDCSEHSRNFRPTQEIAYLDDHGEVIHDTRQKRLLGMKKKKAAA